MTEITPCNKGQTNLVFAHGFADSQSSTMLRKVLSHLPGYNAVAPELGFSMEYVDDTRLYMPYPLDEQKASLNWALDDLESDTVMVAHSQGTFAGLNACGIDRGHVIQKVLAAPVIHPTTEYRRILRAEAANDSGEDFVHIQNALLDVERFSDAFVLGGLRSVIRFDAPTVPPRPRRYAVLSEAYVDSLRQAAEAQEAHLAQLGRTLLEPTTALVLAGQEAVTDARPEVLQASLPGVARFEGTEQNTYKLAAADHNFYDQYEDLAGIIAHRTVMTQVMQ